MQLGQLGEENQFVTWEETWEAAVATQESPKLPLDIAAGVGETASCSSVPLHTGSSVEKGGGSSVPLHCRSLWSRMLSPSPPWPHPGWMSLWRDVSWAPLELKGP